jgi:hypothetical protein
MPARRPVAPLRTRLLGAIHGQLRAMGADRDSPRYQAALAAAGAPLKVQADGRERRSAADLDAAALQRVHAALGGGDGTGPRGPWAPDPKPEHVSDPQWRYLCDLVRQLHLNEQSFARQVQHITGLSRWQWLDVPRCRELIAGLIRIRDYGAPARRVPSRGNPRRRR